VLELFGRDVMRLPRRDQYSVVEAATAYWRHHGFPYPHLSSKEIEREFQVVQRSNTTSLPVNVLPRGTAGLRLANFFHPQMWHAPSQWHRLSPVEFFNDDSRLREMLRRAPRFWPNRRCWNAQCVRSLFRIHSSGRVANFRPLVARTVIERFSPREGRILDFCAGYGGRLLGSLSLPRHYVGIDASMKQVTGSRKMCRALQRLAPGSAELHQGCAEDLLPRIEADSFDLVFSSPPFFDLERYGSEGGQSWVRYSVYEDWKQRFLGVVVREAYRILRPGGAFVVNIADRRRLPLRADLLALAAPLFRHSKLIPMIMHARPMQRALGIETFRTEPIFVFKKRSR
jgi:SAM-dependent methyltransferase